MTATRRRFKQMQTLGERLAEKAVDYLEQANRAPHGVERDRLIRLARQTETASHINDWLTSPGLQPPK